MSDTMVVNRTYLPAGYSNLVDVVHLEPDEEFPEEPQFKRMVLEEDEARALCARLVELGFGP